MPRSLKILLLTVAVAFTAATAGLAFVSFARKVATFRTAGFAAERAGDSLIVDRVTKDKQVAEGDVIVTAGTRSKQYPSLFPADIPIGWVTSVGQSDTAPYKQIQIQPYVDLSSLDAVTALITNKKIPKAP